MKKDVFVHCIEVVIVQIIDTWNSQILLKKFKKCIFLINLMFNLEIMP